MTHNEAVTDVIEGFEMHPQDAVDAFDAFSDFVMLCRRAKIDAGRTFEALLSHLEGRKMANHRGSLAVN